jgi:predicted GH43/DUF377 family glycosyl hydrolase
MKDIAQRFPQNPLLTPADLQPSSQGMQIICLLNPGVFTFQGKTWLLVRVAENTALKKGVILIPVINEAGNIQIIEIPQGHPELIATDPREVRYQGLDYLTTLSHLRLLCSDDGTNFYEPEGYTPLTGKGVLESYGIEDCRVTFLDDKYYLTFTSVSANGVGVGLRTTTNWKQFQTHGMIFSPHNKDCAIFDEKINGLYYALHRPSSVDIGGNFIWLAQSPDGLHWGNHKCILKTRTDNWDSARVGAGAAPIKTPQGWLEIYHGANHQHQYCLGAVLLDLNDPSKVLARTTDPIMIPTEPYETSGFFGNVVFTNGHVVSDDRKTVTIYYGAADEFVCGAKFNIDEIMNMLVWH